MLMLRGVTSHDVIMDILAVMMSSVMAVDIGRMPTESNESVLHYLSNSITVQFEINFLVSFIKLLGIQL